MVVSQQTAEALTALDLTVVSTDFFLRLDDLVGAKYCAPCKGGDFQWVQFPPGDESLQPEAVGAAEEVTNPSKPLM